MKKFLEELFHYNKSSNYNLIKAFLLIDEPDDKIVKIVNHVINAHHIWNRRILGKSSDLEVFGISKPMVLLDIDNHNHMETYRIVNDLELDTKIEYRNSNGEKFVNTVKDILFHVVNHSTYHRGQVALKMRETGYRPLVSDYIFNKRKPVE